jgi:hypothetical protein
MTNIRSTICILTILFLGISACTHVAPTTQQADYGTLVLIYGERECPITLNKKHTVEKGPTWNSKIPGCDFSGVSAIRLENFKSAIELEFESFRKDSVAYPPTNRCWYGNGGYTFTIKTNSAMTTTENFTISEVLATEPDQVIEAGVRLISKKRGPFVGSDASLADIFACVHIRPSD